MAEAYISTVRRQEVHLFMNTREQWWNSEAAMGACERDNRPFDTRNHGSPIAHPRRPRTPYVYGLDAD